ncbi:MAG: hypothetical protein H7122_01150 [Chitinophagaceae bacterium]|nr:hypothetical protein [Chitinophagaceae bacterium]
MGNRKVTVKRSAAESIAAIALYIGSKGMPATAEKFADVVYDYFLKLADGRTFYRACKESVSAALGYKCIPFKKKYTIVILKQ